MFSCTLAGSAVTGTSDPTSLVSAASAVSLFVCAVMSASCALPTWTTPRSESERVAAPARTFATELLNCSVACAICSSAASRLSIAASTA